MKKGQTESYSFFIGVIIAVLILTAIGCAVYNMYKPKGGDYFNKLSSLLEKMEKEGTDGEGEITSYVGEYELLLSFKKEQPYIGKKEADFQSETWKKGCYINIGGYDYPDTAITWSIKRPKQCPLGKDCLCLCKTSSLDIKKEDISCEGTSLCKAFDTLELRGKGGCVDGLFIPGKGFGLIGRSEIVVLHYLKQGNYVIFDDMALMSKEQLEKRLKEIQGTENKTEAQK